MDQRPERLVIFAEHRHHVLRLGGFGKGGKAAHVAEQHDDIAPVMIEDRLAAGRDDGFHDLRRQKPLQPADPLDFVDLRCDPLLQGPVQRSELGCLLLQTPRLRLDRVVQRLDPQHRPHPRRQRGMVDRLGQVIVAAAFEPGDDVRSIGFGRDEDHRDKRQRRVALQLLDGFDAVELRHHDVEQYQIGPKLPDLFQRLDAVAGGDDLIALPFEPHLQDRDIVGHVVDDQDASRLAHFVTPRRAGIRGSWRAIGAG